MLQHVAQQIIATFIQRFTSLTRIQPDRSFKLSCVQRTALFSRRIGVKF